MCLKPKLCHSLNKFLKTFHDRGQICHDYSQGHSLLTRYVLSLLVEIKTRINKHWCMNVFQAIRQVSCGTAHVVALSEDGFLQAWGKESFETLLYG